MEPRKEKGHKSNGAFALLDLLLCLQRASQHKSPGSTPFGLTSLLLQGQEGRGFALLGPTPVMGSGPFRVGDSLALARR